MSGCSLEINKQYHMHFFRESLLDWQTGSGFIFPFDESRRAFKNIWTIENFQSQVDEAMNEYTVSVPKLPNLSEKQKDLSYFIHTQIKKDSNIFHIEEGKRKNYKRKFIKKNSMLSKEATHECPCCQTRYRQKHRCQHTVCEKPCLRQKKSVQSRKKRLKKQNSPSEISMNSFEKQSESENSFDNSEDPSAQVPLDSEEYSISELRIKKKLRLKKQAEEKQSKIEEENQGNQQINNDKPDKKEEPVEKKKEMNEKVAEVEPLQTENNIQGIKNPQQNVQFAKKRGRAPRQPKQAPKRKPIPNKKKILLNDPVEHTSKEMQSEFIPAESHSKSSKEDIIQEEKTQKKRGGGKKRRKNVRAVQNQPETSSVVHTRKKRSILILEEPSSGEQSIQSYDSPPRERRELRQFCEPELLKVDRIFAVHIELQESGLKSRVQKPGEDGKRRRTRNDSSKKEKVVNKSVKNAVQKKGKAIKKVEKSSVKDDDISYKSYKIESYLIGNEHDENEKAEKQNLNKASLQQNPQQKNVQNPEPENQTIRMIRPIYMPEQIPPIKEEKPNSKQQNRNQMVQQQKLNQIEMEYPINQIEDNILGMLQEDRHEADSQENIMRLVDEIEENVNQSSEHSGMGLFFKGNQDPNNSDSEAYD